MRGTIRGAQVLEDEDLDIRLERSARALRAWYWMSRTETTPHDVVAQLTLEARDLIELGRRHPDHAREIGRLIVGYHRLIMQMREAGTSMSREKGTTTAPDRAGGGGDWIRTSVA